MTLKMTGREAAGNALGEVGGFVRGDIVRVRDDVSGELSEPAKIDRFYSDIDGGLKLDRPVHGFWSWNIVNCEKVT